MPTLVAALIIIAAIIFNVATWNPGAASVVATILLAIGAVAAELGRE